MSVIVLMSVIHANAAGGAEGQWSTSETLDPRPDSFLNRMIQEQIEADLAITRLESLSRVRRNAQLMPLLVNVIASETERAQLAASIASASRQIESPSSDQRVINAGGLGNNQDIITPPPNSTIAQSDKATAEGTIAYDEIQIGTSGNWADRIHSTWAASEAKRNNIFGLVLLAAYDDDDSDALPLRIPVLQDPKLVSSRRVIRTEPASTNVSTDSATDAATTGTDVPTTTADATVLKPSKSVLHANDYVVMSKLDVQPTASLSERVSVEPPPANLHSEPASPKQDDKIAIENLPQRIPPVIAASTDKPAAESNETSVVKTEPAAQIAVSTPAVAEPVLETPSNEHSNRIDATTAVTAQASRSVMSSGESSSGESHTDNLADDEPEFQLPRSRVNPMFVAAVESDKRKAEKLAEQRAEQLAKQSAEQRKPSVRVDMATGQVAIAASDTRKQKAESIEAKPMVTDQPVQIAATSVATVDSANSDRPAHVVTTRPVAFRINGDDQSGQETAEQSTTPTTTTPSSTVQSTASSTVDHDLPESNPPVKVANVDGLVDASSRDLTGLGDEFGVQDSSAAAKVAMQWPFKTTQAKPASNDLVSLNVADADVRTVLEMLAKGYGLNILVAPKVEGTVTANVENLTPEQTLQGVLKLCGLSAQYEGDLIFVYPIDSLPEGSTQLRMFTLDYARGESLEAAVQGLLSPVGNAYVSKIDSADQLKAREALIVIDTLDALARVESYVIQADQPPRQVMIQAHVLEVELKDDMKHGVNLDAILGGDLKVGSFGLADPVTTDSNPLFFAQIDGSNVKSLIDLLQTTTDAKTLASPRVMVINGQSARIQVGQQLGFSVATVTQTSTIQDVKYLETGVVLDVLPYISRDNHVMINVKPKVSSGAINPDTKLPEEESRELETSVLLNNHQGIVIGGLIQEDDRTIIRKLPWLGDVKHVGKFFQRREAVRSRSEIIIALVPHIVELETAACPQFCEPDECIKYEQSTTPLFQGPLNRNYRPWEPRMPDVAAESHVHQDIRRIVNEKQ
ncbi:type II secretion system protein GspD [Stieleria varia]|nr:hypothetical protein [Stieleria varia]